MLPGAQQTVFQTLENLPPGEQVRKFCADW
jgi:hypothetical protein